MCITLSYLHESLAPKPSTPLHLQLPKVSLRQTRCRNWFNALPIREASKAKVRVATKTAKDITNIICRRDAAAKSAVPICEDSMNDLNAGIVDVVDGEVEAVLFGTGEVFQIGYARGRTVKVGAWWVSGGFSRTVARYGGVRTCLFALQ